MQKLEWPVMPQEEGKKPVPQKDKQTLPLLVEWRP